MTNTLNSCATLGPGQSIQSSNGEYTLTMEPDGTLVETDSAGDVVFREPAVRPVPGSSCVMQCDGDLQIVTANGRVVWDSRTNVPGSSLVLEDNGQLVIQGPNGAVVATLVAHLLAAVRILQELHEQARTALRSAESLLLRLRPLQSLQNYLEVGPPQGPQPQRGGPAPSQGPARNGSSPEPAKNQTGV